MAPSPSPPPAPGDDVPVSALSRGRLIDVLTDTVGDLERLELPLTVEGIDEARRLRSSLIGQVRDHVLPRLADADVPAIVVVGGSTGAGKSTLVNSVLGREVSDAGVLRPTTRTPVLVVNPEDAEVLADHPVSEVSLTVVSDVVPAGLALVDASDLDSVHEANRTLAVRLLEATDLWLFVTTAARYGDQTPWSTLEEAARRNTPIAVVLNRVPADQPPRVFTQEFTVGRHPSSGIVVANSSIVSGTHLRVVPTPQGWQIHLVSRTNGMLVDGAPNRGPVLVARPVRVQLSNASGPTFLFIPQPAGPAACARASSGRSATTCCPGSPTPTSRRSSSSAARPARASPPWSTPCSGARSPTPGSCAPRPARPCSSSTPRTPRSSPIIRSPR